MSLTHEREHARQLATRIVSFAIGVLGTVLIAFAVVLIVQGGWGFAFASLVLLVLGLGLASVGFFFQLVPFRLDELAEEKRAYDRRKRGE